jgi:hypothetical protein
MPRTIAVEAPVRSGIDLSCVVGRVLVFDDFFSDTQLLLVEQWALTTPHWMLTNSERCAIEPARITAKQGLTRA